MTTACQLLEEHDFARRKCGIIRSMLSNLSDLREIALYDLRFLFGSAERCDNTRILDEKHDGLFIQVVPQIASRDRCFHC